MLWHDRKSGDLKRLPSSLIRAGSTFLVALRPLNRVPTLSPLHNSSEVRRQNLVAHQLLTSPLFLLVKGCTGKNPFFSLEPGHQKGSTLWLRNHIGLPGYMSWLPIMQSIQPPFLLLLRIMSSCQEFKSLNYEFRQFPQIPSGFLSGWRRKAWEGKAKNRSSESYEVLP